MKKILPLILMMPCIAMGASSYPNATSKANFTVTSVSRAVKNQAPVSGVVKDETGSPLPGVSVSIKGTTKGTRTDGNGAFTLNVAPGDVLVFSYVGYVKKEVTVGSQTEYVISLDPNPNSLNEVVVTALGVKKSEKSLVYANQVVSGDQLTAVKTDNLMNSLNGKVAGVDISPSSSGVGGSVKVILRGSKSATGTNQPL